LLGVVTPSAPHCEAFNVDDPLKVMVCAIMTVHVELLFPL
jgi:hypothetical protein